jgi:hypothetical protein
MRAPPGVSSTGSAELHDSQAAGSGQAHKNQCYQRPPLLCCSQQDVMLTMLLVIMQLFLQQLLLRKTKNITQLRS